MCTLIYRLQGGEGTQGYIIYVAKFKPVLKIVTVAIELGSQSY